MNILRNEWQQKRQKSCVQDAVHESPEALPDLHLLNERTRGGALANVTAANGKGVRLEGPGGVEYVSATAGCRKKCL